MRRWFARAVGRGHRRVARHIAARNTRTGGTGGTTTVTLTDCDIQLDGVGFQGFAPSAMKFENNVVGNNGGNQVAFFLNSTGSTSYDLSAGGNELVNCTPASGYHALYAESPSSGVLTVDADNNQWSDTTFPGTNTVVSGNVTLSTQNATGGATCPGP